MGNDNSIDNGMKVYLKQEFERVKSNKDHTYLTVSEVIKIAHPENYPFTFSHLGTLYLLDNQKQGKITLNSLLTFGNFCSRNLKNIQSYEFQAHLQAMATQLLWESMSQNGIKHIINWMEKSFIENEEEYNEKPQFVRIETVKVMYEIFNLKVMSSLDIQQFFDLLQQCGEESGIMALDLEELDEFVPISVCLDFAKDFLKGLKKLMKEIGLDNHEYD